MYWLSVGLTKSDVAETMLWSFVWAGGAEVLLYVTRKKFEISEGSADDTVAPNATRRPTDVAFIFL